MIRTILLIRCMPSSQGAIFALYLFVIILFVIMVYSYFNGGKEMMVGGQTF